MRPHALHLSFSKGVPPLNREHGRACPIYFWVWHHKHGASIFFFSLQPTPTSGQLSLMYKNCLQFLISVPLQLILAVIPWVNYMSEGCVINQKHIGSNTWNVIMQSSSNSRAIFFLNSFFFIYRLNMVIMVIVLALCAVRCALFCQSSAWFIPLQISCVQRT